tara:strand:- start:89 stop:427 length:339 start_codon:yes stop_codon:yes gene_type:complete
MSIYEKWNAARKNLDVDEWASLLHENYTFVRHQSNTTVPRDEWITLAGGMFEAMKNGEMEFHDSRCIYENQDILVQHDVIVFPDGTKEAVMGVHNLKDGKIIKTETGATPVK